MRLQYHWLGDGEYDIIVASTGIRVGYCFRQSSRGSCNEWNFSCAVPQLYRCIIYYSHEPAVQRNLLGDERKLFFWLPALTQVL